MAKNDDFNTCPSYKVDTSSHFKITANSFVVKVLAVYGFCHIIAVVYHLIVG